MLLSGYSEQMWLIANELVFSEPSSVRGEINFFSPKIIFILKKDNRFAKTFHLFTPKEPISPVLTDGKAWFMEAGPKKDQDL